MTPQTKVAVIYYSSTGHVHALAEAATEGAVKAGAEARLLKVAEQAPNDVIAANPFWSAHHQATRDIPEATLEDLEWADALVLGAPTRYRQMASQLKQFIDITDGLRFQGKLANKVYAGFTSNGTGGGSEATMIALNNIFTQWGGIIVPSGYTDQINSQHGDPYGHVYMECGGRDPVGDIQVAAARHMGSRVTEVATWLKGGLAAAA
ncbi:NAD(P)H:quinone oxidoreductase type IV [Streptomyces sp. NPDC002187]|uniref:NAD(P)H:quinone oxidoreductase type IV n=1 Tax=Streptomyces sp. NPDC002187 TaxID=3364637 RepID=UPI00369195A5